MRIDEVGRLTGLGLPEGDAYDTIGGLVMAELRRLPRAGDRLTVALDSGPVELEVVSLARRVAEKILIRTAPAAVPAPRSPSVEVS
jgi:CBS domain containing-hemolysin-like protein